MALRSLSIGSQAVASPTGIGSVYQTVYDARSYGVVADGVTVNTTNLQNLINTVQTAGGGIIMLPYGVVLTADLVLSSNNVSIIGQGQGTTFLRAVSGTNILLLINGWSYGNIRALTLDGAGNANYGVVADEPSTSTFTMAHMVDVTILNCTAQTGTKTDSQGNTISGVGMLLRGVHCFGWYVENVFISAATLPLYISHGSGNGQFVNFRASPVAATTRVVFLDGQANTLAPLIFTNNAVSTNGTSAASPCYGYDIIGAPNVVFIGGETETLRSQDIGMHVGGNSYSRVTLDGYYFTTNGGAGTTLALDGPVQVIDKASGHYSTTPQPVVITGGNSNGNPIYIPEGTSLGLYPNYTRVAFGVNTNETATGAPTTGNHLKGEAWVDSAGTWYVCTAAGSPGTWTQIALGSTANTFLAQQTATAFSASGLTGSTAGARITGGVAAGPPASGPYLKGDLAVDQTGTAWICTTAGTPGTWTQIAPAFRNLQRAASTGPIILASSFPRWSGTADSGGSILSTGRMTLVSIEIAGGQLVTSLGMCSGTTALSAGAGPYHMWFALFDSNGNLLGQTADQTSGLTWAANTMKTIALASTYTTPAGLSATYYIAVMIAGVTTLPSLRISNLIAAMANAVPVLVTNDVTNTGLTTTAPNPCSITAQGSSSMPFAYIQ